VKVKLSEPALADDLVSFLRRAQCEAERGENGTLTVTLPDALPEEAARLELEAYLTAWRALHPGVLVRRCTAYDL
jgi:hypothetical protein